jgi:hypothetical protein
MTFHNVIQKLPFREFCDGLVGSQIRGVPGPLDFGIVPGQGSWLEDYIFIVPKKSVFSSVFDEIHKLNN